MKSKLSSEILLLIFNLNHIIIGAIYLSKYMESNKVIHIVIVVLAFFNGIVGICNSINSMRKIRYVTR